MIVSLEELKRVLGIALDDTDEDDNLTRLILAKTTWVEGTTLRRFDAPIARTEYHDGTDERELYLFGHVDDSAGADSDALGDPSASVQVFFREKLLTPTDWEALVEGTDWERRDDTLIYLSGWSTWSRCNEYKITYLDGYEAAPEDIKEVIIELAVSQYLRDVQSSAGKSGITSESLGDYSYNLDLTVAAGASGKLTDTSMKTILRYKRKLV